MCQTPSNTAAPLNPLGLWPPSPTWASWMWPRGEAINRRQKCSTFRCVYGDSFLFYQPNLCLWLPACPLWTSALNLFFLNRAISQQFHIQYSGNGNKIKSWTDWIYIDFTDVLCSSCSTRLWLLFIHRCFLLSRNSRSTSTAVTSSLSCRPSMTYWSRHWAKVKTLFIWVWWCPLMVCLTKCLSYNYVPQIRLSSIKPLPWCLKWSRLYLIGSVERFIGGCTAYSNVHYLT